MCKAIDDYTEKGHMRQNFCVEHNINNISIIGSTHIQL